MQTNLPATLTILGMALITYLTRAGGLWFLARVPLSPRVKAWLGALPAAVLISIVAPTVLSTGFPEAGAALATLLVAARTRNILLSMLTGIITVLLLRMLFASLHKL
jgi:uncharacterized membrane protein